MRGLRFILGVASVVVALLSTEGAPMASEGPPGEKPKGAPLFYSDSMTLREFYKATVDREDFLRVGYGLVSATLARGYRCSRIDPEWPLTPVWRFRQDVVRWYFAGAMFRDGGEPTEAGEPLLLHWMPYLHDWCSEKADSE